MIRIRALGHICRALGSEMIQVDSNRMTINLLLETLSTYVKENSEPPLSTSNTLVAVNGVEISALKGCETVIHEGDKVILIPITHGG